MHVLILKIFVVSWCLLTKDEAADADRRDVASRKVQAIWLCCVPQLQGVHSRFHQSCAALDIHVNTLET